MKSFLNTSARTGQTRTGLVKLVVLSALGAVIALATLACGAAATPALPAAAPTSPPEATQPAPGLSPTATTAPAAQENAAPLPPAATQSPASLLSTPTVASPWNTTTPSPPKWTQVPPGPTTDLCQSYVAMVKEQAETEGAGGDSISYQECKEGMTQIKFGETIPVGAGGMRLQFAELAEDSRCPRGVTCIWAGRAVIVLKVQGGSGNLDDLQLTLGEGEDGASRATVEGYRVTLAGLDPYPVSNQPARPEEYVAHLVIVEE